MKAAPDKNFANLRKLTNNEDMRKWINVFPKKVN